MYLFSYIRRTAKHSQLVKEDYINEMDYQNADTDSAQDLQSAKNNLSASDKNGDQALKKVKTDTPTNRIEEDTAINRRNKKLKDKVNEQAKELHITEESSEGIVSTRKRKRRYFNASEEIGVSYEEEKMLNLAIRNSIREQKAGNFRDFSTVKDMKVFYPTESEFKDPIKYFENLYKEGMWKYGCIKIIPPSTFKPPFCFDTTSDKKLPTRYQVLQDLSQGKAFDQNESGHTLKEFKSIAKKFQQKYFAKFKNLSHEERTLALEKEYWRFVEDNVGEKIKVEYAADLSAKDYGSGFPVHSDNEYSTHSWNFNNLDKGRNSLLQICNTEKISGINIPWVYVGMLFSSFCWHYEDIMMFSVNYMHKGEGKMWYGIPSQDRSKFERIAKDKLAILFEEDPNVLMNITAMISPDYIAENGVNVYKAEQRPGEFILTFPESYHAGWSTGFNIAEAVNIVSKSWIDYGLKSMNVYLKSREKVPVFPIQWIATENVIKCANAESLNMDKETRLEVIRFYENIMNEELVERSMIRSHFHDKEDFNNSVLKPFPSDQLKSFSGVECFYCINLCYLSYVKCGRCKKTYCIAHEIQCGCPVNKIRIHCRYTNEELRCFLDNAQKYIEKIEKEEKILKRQNNELTDETMIII